MIRKDLVVIDSDALDQDTVLNDLAQRAFEQGLLSDKESFLAAVKKREAEIPTSVGFEVAIPHGRTDAVKESFVGVMRTKKSFIWDARNNEPVKVIFLLGVPETEGDTTHLRFLSQISKKLMNAEFREQLNQCKNRDEAFDLLNEINQNL